MNEFLQFYNKLVKTFPLHLYISQNKTTDWRIKIVKVGCGTEYRNARYSDDLEDVILVEEQGPDMELVFARAYVGLKEWLLEFEGGY